jgi:hypothetical protein
MLPNASIPKRLSMIVENGLIAGINEIPNKGSRKSIEFVRNFSFLIHENRIFCLFPYSRGYAYAKTRIKIAIFIRIFGFSHSFWRSCFSFSNSSSDKVMPLPIFACSGAQSRMSYLGVPPFHEILFSSFVHPFGLLEITPRCSMISYLNSDHHPWHKHILI